MGQSITITLDEFSVLFQAQERRSIRINIPARYNDLPIPPHEIREIARKATFNRKELRLVRGLVNRGLLCETDRCEGEHGTLYVFQITKPGKQVVREFIPSFLKYVKLA